MIRQKTIVGQLDANGNYALDDANPARVGIYVVNRSLHEMNLIFDGNRFGMPLYAAAAAGGIGGMLGLDRPGLVIPDSYLSLNGTAGDLFVCILSIDTDKFVG